MIIPDNASTASNRIDTTSRTRDVNPTYQEFLSWYNTAAVPTRSRAPRDKATVEASVKIITADVTAALTGTGYIDIDDVNQQVTRLVDTINDRVPFRRQQQSRRQLFTDTEAACLHPLPEHPNHQVFWHTRKVGRNFHIEIHKARYFAPYQHVGDVVDIRIIGTTLDVLHHGAVIASHTVATTPGVMSRIRPTSRHTLRLTPSCGPGNSFSEKPAAMGPTPKKQSSYPWPRSRQKPKHIAPPGTFSS